MSEEGTTTAEAPAAAPVEASSAESAVADMVSAPAATATETTNRPESVPEKFWNNETSSINAEAAVKSYTELESKFGAFTGAPDDYGFNVSEEMTKTFQDMGVEISVEGDPLYEAALEFAKTSGMNQEGMDGLTNLFLMTQLGQRQADADFKATQLQELGDRADQRLTNINAWGENNLSPELYQSLQDSLTNAAMVPILEHMIAASRNAPVSTPEALQAPAVDPGALMKMQFEKDEHGNRRTQTDPAFKAEYERQKAAMYGDAENRIMVG